MTRYEDIREATRDPETFINGGGPQWGKARPPLEVDRPVHTHFRRLLQPYFHKHRIAALEPKVRAAVVEMLQPLLDAGGGDIAPALTYPLPARVLADFLHLPEDAWEFLKAWSEELFENEEGRGSDPAKRARDERAVLRVRGRPRGAAQGRSAPDPTRTSSAACSSADGVTEDDVVQVLRLLLTAGHNSTTSALGICILAVARDADVQRRLRDDPSLIPSAVDEFMRLETPVMAMPRWAAARHRAARPPDPRRATCSSSSWQSANRDDGVLGRHRRRVRPRPQPEPAPRLRPRAAPVHRRRRRAARAAGDAGGAARPHRVDRARRRAGAHDLGALRRLGAAAAVPLLQVP